MVFFQYWYFSTFSSFICRRASTSAKTRASKNKVRQSIGLAQANLANAVELLDTPTVSSATIHEDPTTTTADMETESVETGRAGGNRDREQAPLRAFAQKSKQKLGKLLQSSVGSRRPETVVLPGEQPLDQEALPREPSWQAIYDALASNLDAAGRDLLKTELLRLEESYERAFHHLWSDLRSGASRVVITTRSGRSFAVDGPGMNNRQ
ncbi:Oidioi.mRNA.OKI2018_I69.chr1.g2864.t1.cds [Oikopleura dioica]|uniref:Oidioi.mRNA.OKI2018_I69.chr1.g2864.t1.cds n=1 Tax=Oikopleura dioica TaxID=34765 RepID=A0ABN7SVW3_OIKDI|nr:Oidioi.mRNA.OKI2018_I69.chr1.g2864.t1.cds [Oikopleura dioica]